MSEENNHEAEIQLYARALNGLTDLICIMDAEGRVVFANQSFLDTFGYSLGELAAQPAPLQLLIARAGGDASTEYSFHRGWRGEMSARKKDGTEFRVHLSAMPVRGDDYRTLGLICTARPAIRHDEALKQIRQLASALEQKVLVRTAEVVTQKDELARINAQLGKLVQELEAAKRKAEESNKVKSQFLAHVSHEMRTPLNSVIGFANLLTKNKEAHLSEQDLFYLNRIVGNATHLLKVVGQMLDLSMIETGKLGLVLSEVPLGELVRETIAELRGHAKSESVPMIADIPKGTQPIETDRQKLKQVLINLLANALKFTKSGAVTVRVAVDALRRPIRVEVIDTGVGIAQGRLEAIFEAFERAQPAANQESDGTGLGLTICRSLCNLMGYTITVESEVGKGSSFTIHLAGGPVPGHA